MSGEWLSSLFRLFSCTSQPPQPVHNPSAPTNDAPPSNQKRERPPRLHSPEVIAFLQKYTQEQKHFKKSFFKHLTNVHDLLYYKFGECEYLCDAGLFHSIYGTEFFKMSPEILQDKDPITREKIQSLIGLRAEELVHIFCSLRSNRLEGILNNSLAWSTSVQLDLCKLEYANLLDQNYHQIHTPAMQRLAAKIKELRALRKGPAFPWKELAEEEAEIGFR